MADTVDPGRGFGESWRCVEIRMSSSEQTSSEQAWTLGRLLTWTTDFLKQHGSESPQLDAQLLLAHARKCERIELYTAYGEEAPESLRSEFRELVRQRAAGTPVAYLIGHREFYSLDFRVTPEVLIPRPETEFLVIAVTDLVKRAANEGASLTIADVGTGSGILASCLAKHLVQAHIWATDISSAALEIARQNCTTHGVVDRVQFVCGNLFDPVPHGVWFDFIVSNPPYVTTAEYAQLAREVREHEPRQALVAGDKGTEVIERLIPHAARKLKPGGWLLLEISPMIEQAVHELVVSDGRFTAPETIRDLAGHARVVQAAIPI